MISGATETSFHYLSKYYKFPDNVHVSHIPKELKESSKQYKILWAHHSYDQFVYQEFSHEQVDHIVAPSKWAKDQLVEFHKIPENKISVIFNGVDEMFSFSPNKKKKLIYSSIPYKGLPVLADIIPRVHQKHPDAIFEIFSSMSLYGNQMDPYLELYEHLKTLPNVHYSKCIDREELVSHYQDSAFFVHPNIWEETFCVSMVEAMRCGCYPIITDIGAIEEVAGENNATVVSLEGKRTPQGYIVTENFVNYFADAVSSALSYFDEEREIYDQISKKCSDHATIHYDWKKIAHQWESLIDSLTCKTPKKLYNRKVFGF